MTVCEGHPALSIPVAMSEGLPIGMQVVGRHQDEGMLYALAGAWERHADWTKY